MSPYLKYFNYIIKHKWWVAVECFKERLYLHAITHDLSKFLPSEFIVYAKHFYTDEDVSSEFREAFRRHLSRNPHHWEYWVSSDGSPKPMPLKHTLQMACDLRAMGRTGLSAREFYNKNKHKFNLHPTTRKALELII